MRKLIYVNHFIMSIKNYKKKKKKNKKKKKKKKKKKN